MTESKTVIRVDNLSKRYSRSLKHGIWYGLKDVGKELVGLGQDADDLRPTEFWALRNVSFTISSGESVGLIGHNGAGKTTLLKLINGLIKPTHGKVAVDGSVRALIALGTGFNPVLTGRENVRVASAVLGYSEKEANQRFDEIVEFSEVGEFIDAPVQSYSSGMLARLGFAVAVHTRPDILLVDEVLAVGDLNFAIKCYRKIAEFRSEGGSIVLVSHNPYAIRTNCERVVWIEHGEVQQIGAAREVCNAYDLAVARQDASSVQSQVYNDGTVQLASLDHPSTIKSGARFPIELELEASRPLVDPIVALSVSTISGQTVVANESAEDGVKLEIRQGRSVIRAVYPTMPLVRGVYSISVVIAEGSINNQVAALVNHARFEVEVDALDAGAGMVHLLPRWEPGAGAVR
jgi:lipopolysaccharide transport system ATP-binding protein